MRTTLPGLFAALALLCGALVPAAADPRITARDLRKHVEYLASERLAGRAPLTPGGRAAAEYVVKQFTRLGLAPKGENGSPFQAVLDGDGKTIGRNVCFLLPGRSAETVVIGAHYDHLGKGEEGTFAGADDNASGVAALIEMAEQFATAKAPPARSLLFLAFDNEEEGLRGSEQWAWHPTIPIRDVVAMVNLDMVGRSMMDRFPGSVFAFGTEWSRDMSALLHATPRAKSVDVWDIGTEFVGPRSDFLHFALRGVPFVFFTTGTHSAYHTPRDVPQDVDYASAESITRTIAGFVGRIADAPARPRFEWIHPNGLREAEVCHKIVTEMIAHPLPDTQSWQLAVMKFVDGRTQKMIARKHAGCLDRALMILSTQALTLTLVESERTSPTKKEDRGK